ncbi:MAG: hypothetical protein WC606_03340 [Candidatus Absconditabacterales bacterium]
MTETIEKKIDTPVGGGSAEKTDYSKVLEGLSSRENLGNKESEEAKKQAAELLNKIQGTPGAEVKKEAIKKNPSILPPEVKTAINQLNRPEAEKGIEQSYANIDATIKNSKNEKGIGGFLGKIMNKILGQ